jgi:hypothetical protein
VTFNDGFSAGCPSPAGAYTNQHLVFTNASANKWCSPTVNNFVRAAGDAGGKLNVEAIVTGRVFDFHAIDVCNIDASTGPQTVVLTGTKTDGHKVSESFTTGNDTAPKTLVPKFLAGLVKLHVDLGKTAFDNVVFSGPPNDGGRDSPSSDRPSIVPASVGTSRWCATYGSNAFIRARPPLSAARGFPSTEAARPPRTRPDRRAAPSAVPICRSVFR